MSDAAAVTELLRQRAEENGLTPAGQRWVEHGLRDLDALYERTFATIGERLERLRTSPMRVEVNRRQVTDLWLVVSTLVTLTQRLAQGLHEEVVNHEHKVKYVTALR